jgi:CubicO group peptidase (beta-lactamase class C family)
MLRPPEPARGLEASLGVTLFANPFASGNRDPVLPLPYLAVAQGDGQVEFNFSIQWGLRGGVKLGLGPGLALDAGLTLLPLDWSRWVPVVLDGGAILGGDGFYFSPRVHLIRVPTPSGGSWEWAWQAAWQASLGTYRRDWVAEVGALGGFGRILIHLSAAWRFGIAP